MKTLLRLWRSSHLRNVALATLLSGLLLTPLAVFYARSVRAAERNRLDAYIRELSLLHLSHAGLSAEAWRIIDRDLPAVNLTSDMRPPMILVRDHAGNPIYCSPGWTIDAHDRRLLTAATMTERYAAYVQRYLLSPEPEGPPLNAPPPPPTFKWFNWPDDTGHVWRVGVTGTPEGSLALAMDWTTRKAGYVLFVRALIVALPTAMLLIAALSYFLSYRALRPVRLLQATAEHITVQGLGERIPTVGQDIEFEGLVNVFNGMLDRLERSFNQANLFSAAAAHELKTPLSVLQAELERGIQDAALGDAEQERYSRLLEQVQRLKTITHRLLLLATIDAGGFRLQKESFDLSACILDACEDAVILAPDITMSVNIPPGILLAADAELMPQVISNLVTNATTHNEPGGSVSLSLTVQHDRVVFTLSNTGPGIPAADRSRLFTRFYRADRSRSRVRGGSGLGLSLARDIARAHGGDITLVASDATGTTFRLELPRVPAG